MSTQGLRQVAAVLEQVLTDFGRRAADDPRRLKGLITDTLGADASELHDAIEAVVAVAEAGVPQAALSDADDRNALVELARSHLAEPENAEEVVEIWIAALRVQDRIPTDGPTVAAPLDRTIAASEATQLPSSSDEETMPMPAMEMSSATSSPGTRERIASFVTERKAVVFSGAAVLVLVLGGVAAASMLNGGGTTSTTTTVADKSTTTIADTTTTAVELVTSIDHEEYVTSWGATVNRSWGIDGDRLVMKVSVESGDEEIEGTVWEIFPESWGIDASTLKFDTGELMRTVHSNDTVVRLVFVLPAKASWPYEYSIPLPEGGDDPLFLQNLLAEWELAMTEFLATPPPSLEITSDSPVGDQVTFRGSTTPGTEVQVDGKVIEVAEDGSFEHTAMLAPGENLVVVRAVDHVRGQAKVEELKWTYTPTTTPTVTTPTVTTPTVTTPTVTTPTVTTPTVPPNQAPYLTGNCTATSSFALDVSSGSAGFYNLKECFDDPEGDTLTYTANAEKGSLAAAGFSDTKANWTYFPGTDACPYSDTINVWVKDPQGLASNPLVFFVTINGC
jgi:hypothetical protein